MPPNGGRVLNQQLTGNPKLRLAPLGIRRGGHSIAICLERSRSVALQLERMSVSQRGPRTDGNRQVSCLRIFEIVCRRVRFMAGEQQATEQRIQERISMGHTVFRGSLLD